MADISSEIDFDSPIRKRSYEERDDEALVAKRGKSSVNRGRGRGRGRGRASISSDLSNLQLTEVDASENDLSSLVKTLRIPIETTVGDWIEDYKRSKELATINLIQFFIFSCGSKNVANKGFILANKYTDIVRTMTEEYDEETGDYPIISSNQQLKRYRMNMCDFVQTLIKRCQHSIIYDQFIMDHVISFLTVLADSQVRAFRHTSTVAATKIVTALVEAAVGVLNNLDGNKRQHETEKLKNPRKPNERSDLLAQNIIECQQNLEEIQNMVAYLIKSIFVHRYRDVVPDIRSTCISELGHWMKIHPKMFLEDTYLKYIGWTLYDKVAEVRMKCLQTLVPLYSNDDIGNRMELFTTKFKSRISSMAMDKDQDVAVCAVNLILQLSKLYRDIFDHKEVEFVFELVYTTNRSLATAAGEYLSFRLFAPLAKPISSRRGKQRSPNTPLIRDLLQFHIESMFHEHAAYIVDSLIDNHEMMKDWECMTDLLLDEPNRDEKALTEQEERILIEIITCAVKQSATTETPVGRIIHKRPYTTQKEQKQLSDDRAKITDHFITALPPLIQKFIADSEKLANLLLIPQHFQLDVYTNLRLDKYLDQLLSCIEEVLDRHTDEELLSNCSKTLESLCGENLGIQQRCQTTRAKMVDKIVVALRHNLEQFRREGDDADEEDVAAVAAGFKKLAALYGYHDLHQWDIWNVANSVMQPQDEEAPKLPPEVIEKVIKICFLSLNWDLKRYLDTGFDNEAAENLKSRVHNFLAVCREFCASAESACVRESAFLAAGDILSFFGWQLGERNKTYLPLVVEADSNLENSLGTFIHDYVFIEAEEDEMDEHTALEVLHKRRNLLATFCRLIINRLIHDKCGCSVYQQYNKFFSDYGDIIKSTVTKVRDANKINCARALSCALTQQFTTLKEESEDGNVDPQSEGFASLKDLAKKFGACFGNDPVRYREAVAHLHKEGIDFAVHGDCYTIESGNPPPNLDFLEVLSELTNKLMKNDKPTLVRYLTRHVVVPEDADDGWQSLFVYRNSLMQGVEEMPPPQAIPLTSSAIVKRGRGRPARSNVSTISGPFVPQVTSTVLRGDLPAPKRQRQNSVSHQSEASSDQDCAEQEIPGPNFSSTSYM